MDFLKFKTGINIYRTFAGLVAFFAMLLAVVSLIVDYPLLVMIVSFFVAATFIMMTIFMDKFVYLFKLPTYYLIVNKEEIIYKMNKKQFVFKVGETDYSFHPFSEDFSSLPQLRVISGDIDIHISITKKQFKEMVQFLDGGNN